eukprot:COSAG02_NODE_1565_length_11911_cov_10.325940_4_plen_213_part_00
MRSAPRPRVLPWPTSRSPPADTGHDTTQLSGTHMRGTAVGWAGVRGVRHTLRPWHSCSTSRCRLAFSSCRSRIWRSLWLLVSTARCFSAYRSRLLSSAVSRAIWCSWHFFSSSCSVSKYSHARCFQSTPASPMALSSFTSSHKPAHRPPSVAYSAPPESDLARGAHVGNVGKFPVSEMKICLNLYRRLNSLKIIVNPSTDSATAKWRFGRDL